MPETREGRAAALIALAEQSLRGALDQDAEAAERLVAGRLAAWAARADAATADRLARSVALMAPSGVAQAYSHGGTAGSLPVLAMTRSGRSPAAQPRSDLGPPAENDVEAFVALHLGRRIAATEAAYGGGLERAVHDLGMPARLAQPADLAAAAHLADQLHLESGEPAPVASLRVEAVPVTVAPFASAKRRRKATLPLSPAEAGPFVASAFGRRTAESAEDFASFRLKPWLHAMRHAADTLENPIFRLPQTAPAPAEPAAHFVAPEREYDEDTHDPKAFSDELSALEDLPAPGARKPPRKAQPKTPAKPLQKAPARPATKPPPKSPSDRLAELTSLEGLVDLPGYTGRIEDDLIDPSLFQPTPAPAKPAPRTPAPAFRKTSLRLDMPAAPAGSLLSDLFETRPGEGPAPAPRAPRLLALNEMQADAHLQALRRAARFGARETLSTLLRASGATLLAEPATHEAVTYLTRLERSSGTASEESVSWLPQRAGAMGRAIARAMADLGAPPLLVNVARVFPYDSVAALRLPPPPEQPRAVTFSARLRATRSLNWFRAGAPRLDPHHLDLTAAADGAPVLNHGEAGETLRPMPPDRRDPGLVWTSFIAHVVADGSAERRAVREALIVHLSPWMALAEILSVTPQDGLHIADEAFWFHEALHPAPEATPPHPFVLVVERQSGSLADIADAVTANCVVYALDSRRWRRPHPDGLPPQEALVRCALVLTDAPGNAIGPALSGKLTLVVDDGPEARRLPPHDRLRLVERSKAKRSLAAALRTPAAKPAAGKSAKTTATGEKAVAAPKKRRKTAASTPSDAATTVSTEIPVAPPGETQPDAGKAKRARPGAGKSRAAKASPRPRR